VGPAPGASLSYLSNKVHICLSNASLRPHSQLKVLFNGMLTRFCLGSTVPTRRSGLHVILIRPPITSLPPKPLLLLPILSLSALFEPLAAAHYADTSRRLTLIMHNLFDAGASKFVCKALGVSRHSGVAGLPCQQWLIKHR
jgi:hypothetical protein